MIDEDAAKIAEHVNPFRFLSEVKLSKLPGDYGTKELPLNPMVDAYFNQFGRPYVAEEPQDVIKETKKVQSKEERSSYKGLSLRNSMFVY